MRLTRIYANQEKLFPDIDFRDGLNVVLGEIRRPETREPDTHNLGKTTLAELIDFCLLKAKSQDQFLYRHEKLFEDFVFYLEILTHSGQSLTIRRAVSTGSKAALKTHSDRRQDLRSLPEEQWDHWNAPFERARSLVDGILDMRAVAPWSFRHAVGYSLRTQKDYEEAFKLAKYGGRHAEWKPFLAHVLGLDSKSVKRSYELADEISKKESDEERLRAELSGVAENLDQLRGLVDIAEREVQSLSTQTDAYNFDLADAEINKELVGELDRDIAELNERRYQLTTDHTRVRRSLGESILFDLKKAEKLFKEASVYFGDQLKKDFSDLTAFNKELSEERDEYLRQEEQEISAELQTINEELTTLQKQRATALRTLRDKETFSKYKRLSNRLVEKRTNLEVLRRRRDAVASLQETRKEIRELLSKRNQAIEAIEECIESPTDRYSAIREWFDEILHAVVGQHANLYSTLNTKGNIEFKTDIVNEKGESTSASRGHTYGRLLCIAFDMSVVRSYMDTSYPHFIYHDGALESLDDRKKLNLIDVIRDDPTSTQQIITLIDSELPKRDDGSVFEFEEEEVILVLHDEGDEGQLFKMPSW